MITFQGHPQDGGLYTGYNVFRDKHQIGFIDVCGIFRKNTDNTSLTEEDRETIKVMCRSVYKMPSEYGCLGVGESPTESFEDFLSRTNIRHDLDPFDHTQGQS